MTLAPGILEPEAEEMGAAAPQVFVRTFTTPSGMPWDQSKASALEARHGAPLPIGELMYRLRRLEPWRLGEPGRYAVFYLRRKDYKGPFETTVDVDGEAIRVAYGSNPVPVKRFATLAALFVIFVMLGSVLGGGLMKVGSLRQSADEELELLERAATAKLRQAQRIERRQRNNRDLADAQGQAGMPANVLADIAWIQHARTPDARIVAVHWDRGVMAIEARGEGAPVMGQDRQIVRAKRPIRDGVWLWGISPTPAPTRASAAVAEFGP